LVKNVLKVVVGVNIKRVCNVLKKFQRKKEDKSNWAYPYFFRRIFGAQKFGGEFGFGYGLGLNGEHHRRVDSRGPFLSI